MENAKIAKKLVAVMNECSHVAKNGINSFHNYKYATAEDVLQKVNESLTKISWPALSALPLNQWLTLLILKAIQNIWLLLLCRFILSTVTAAKV